MEGVILYADDHIFENEQFVNKLFHKFNLDGGYSIIPINNLNVLEKTISSISTYKALILDWNFKRPQDDEDADLGLKVPDENPYEFLKANSIYSLIYIYSQEVIDPHIIAELKELYPNKIFFEKKMIDNHLDTEFEKITNGIKSFEAANTHLRIPYVWSQTINKSAQRIFSELENADPNWIKEIYTTAITDGVEPNNEVIGIFQNLLSESIVQDQNLAVSLAEASKLDEIVVTNKAEAQAKLYNRIYYTKLLVDAPIMTGDIFKFSEDEFAILITPECDVNGKKDISLEFLKLSISASKAFIDKKKKDDGSLFNNGVQSRHILPSFPFVKNEYRMSALIDFESAFIVKSKSDFQDKRDQYKLNSPYIFQLRQRYLSYIGRVGVPAMPKSLKMFNLHQ